MFLDKVKQLGSQVENELLTRNYKIEELPEIAAPLLKNFGLVSHEEIMGCICNSIQDVGEQYSPEHIFGDSRFTLYRGFNFVIELNVWQMNFTQVHEHSFTGAFKILHGSALEAIYDFEVSESFANYLDRGKLKRKEVNIFEAGSISKITPGEKYIHNLMHFNNPTYTLIVRSTSGEKANIFQRSFIGRNYAFHGWFYSDLAHNAKSAISILTKSKSKDLTNQLCQIFKSLNFLDTFAVVKETWNIIDYGSQSKLVNMLKTNHEADRVKEMLESIDSYWVHAKSFGGYRDKDLSDKTRKILAVLANSNNREEIEQLLNRVVGDFKGPIEKYIIENINTNVQLFDEEHCQDIVCCIPELLGDNLDDECQLIKEQLRKGVLRSLVEV